MPTKKSRESITCNVLPVIYQAGIFSATLDHGHTSHDHGKAWPGSWIWKLNWSCSIFFSLAFLSGFLSLSIISYSNSISITGLTCRHLFWVWLVVTHRISPCQLNRPPAESEAVKQAWEIITNHRRCLRFSGLSSSWDSGWRTVSQFFNVCILLLMVF